MDTPSRVTFVVDYNEIYMQGYIAGQIGHMSEEDCPYVTIPMVRAWIDGYKASKVAQDLNKVYGGHIGGQ